MLTNVGIESSGFYMLHQFFIDIHFDEKCPDSQISNHISKIWEKLMSDLRFVSIGTDKDVSRSCCPVFELDLHATGFGKLGKPLEPLAPLNVNTLQHDCSHCHTIDDLRT